MTTHSLSSLKILITLAIMSMMVSLANAATVVTFSQDDLSRILGEVFGERPDPKKKLRIHRSFNNKTLHIVFPSRGEAILHSNRQEQFPVSDLVCDTLRLDNGQVAAVLAEDTAYPMLMVGDQAPIRGRGYDVDPAGRALMISQKSATVLCTLDKPYFTKLSLPDFDGRRLFARRGELLLVGNNNKTNLVEARVIRVNGPGVYAEAGSLNLPNVAAGVRVLDYDSTSDELLLGGVDATGAGTFAIYNLTNGQGRTVSPNKPGDTEALFLDNSKLANRLTGRSGATPNRGGGFFNELFGGISL